jgi:hypothetical protein
MRGSLNRLNAHLVENVLNTLQSGILCAAFFKHENFFMFQNDLIPYLLFHELVMVYAYICSLYSSF